MKVVEYNETRNIKIMFLDDYKYIVTTAWHYFNNGDIKNPYFPATYGFGMIGSKYPSRVDGKITKEYNTWSGMLERCFSEKYTERHPAYIGVTCCKEWSSFEIFYEWLHSQENFDKWILDKRSALDKDIVHKGNKIYSPNNCCLVSHDVNTLFCKRDRDRGEYPIGVTYNKKFDKYNAKFQMNITHDKRYTRQLGTYPTPEDAFYLGYKPYKEAYIKQIAKEEYEKGNITKKCYDAMMSYEVEITD